MRGMSCAARSLSLKGEMGGEGESLIRVIGIGGPSREDKSILNSLFVPFLLISLLPLFVCSVDLTGLEVEVLWWTVWSSVSVYYKVIMTGHTASSQ